MTKEIRVLTLSGTETVVELPDPAIKRQTRKQADVLSNGDYMHFEGQNLKCSVQDDGSLLVENWETERKHGNTVFAEGEWTSMSLGQAWDMESV